MSAQSFDDYKLRAASHEALRVMNITTPTPIQAATIGPILEGHDVIGQAKTGSGKTLAFSLPMLEAIRPGLRTVQALVLVPTRELALQVYEVVAALSGRSGPKVAAIYGGKPMGAQITALKNGAQIVIGTPGRVLDHLRSHTMNLRQVRYLVLDEADEMLDRGFAPDVERIMEFAGPERQTLLFSATLAGWVHQMASRHLHDPITVEVDRDDPRAGEHIEQLVLEVPNGYKRTVLMTLLDRRGDGNVLVFGRTKHGVKKLGARLESEGFPVAVLQGNLSQAARDRAMADFRSGKLPILVATNVAARGIDVTSVERVINFELPDSADLFTHRIGRTGRMGRAGEAITLLSPAEEADWARLERELGRKLPRETWDEPLDGHPDMSEVKYAQRRGSAPARPGLYSPSRRGGGSRVSMPAVQVSRATTPVVSSDPPSKYRFEYSNGTNGTNGTTEKRPVPMPSAQAAPAKPKARPSGRPRRRVVAGGS